MTDHAVASVATAAAALDRRYVTRRTWLAQHVHAALFATVAAPAWRERAQRALHPTNARPEDLPAAARLAAQATRLELGPFEALIRRAVEAATAAGASYADARLTRTVRHMYEMTGSFLEDTEDIGVGVRVLVQGYWGFSASPYVTPDAVVRAAQDAVELAKENAKGTPRVVDLGTVPVVTGQWSTPIQIDPFTVSVEEKLDHIQYWHACAADYHDEFIYNGLQQPLVFTRQERLLATSAGSLVTQTVYETAGLANLKKAGMLDHLDAAGRGWELFLDANIPEQIPQRLDQAKQQAALGDKPVTVGRYTLVLDGTTMASILDRTLGVATQLDRALGYEANASGTSFVNDPLTMLGSFQIAAPTVTVTVNRSAPTQLATVKWDDEGVEPEPFTVVKNGVLTDFQTTREQAAWLTPYYQQHGRPVRSHGCAAAQDALSEPMQMMPNLALEPSPSSVRLDDLVAGVSQGILIERGFASDMDFQARTGLIRGGRLRQITNGRLGRPMTGGAVLFNTQEFWKHIQILGGPATAAWIGVPATGAGYTAAEKGEPAQRTSYSVSAVAAVVPNQAVIDPARKA